MTPQDRAAVDDARAKLAATASLCVRAVRLRQHADAMMAAHALQPPIDANLLGADDVNATLVRAFEAAGEPRGWSSEIASWLTTHAREGRTCQASIPAIRPAEIDVQAGGLAQQVDAGLDALLEARLGIYRRAGQLVRVGVVTEGGAEIVHMSPLNEAHLNLLLSQAANWSRLDVRALAYVATNPPPSVAKSILGQGVFGRRVPEIRSIVNAPTLRPDGSILDLPGYDAATGLFLDPRGVAFPEIPEVPTREDAIEALHLLLDLVAEVPFVDEVDEVVSLSAILTALVRGSLPAAPAHAFTAPAPGTGKSYLAGIVSRIALGRDAAALAYGPDEAENRKVLESALLEGKPGLLFDNVQHELAGARFAEVLTQPEVTVRPLGRSETVTVPCSPFVLVDGNNLTIARDLTRRVLLSRLDRKTERPELHRFTFDPLARIAEDRGRYVVAGLTVLRAYRVAGRPGLPPALGGFEAWSNLVRGALIWLGLPDPTASIERVRESDPRRSELLAVLAGWDRALGSRRTTSAGLDLAATGDPAFRDALLAVAGVAGRVHGQRLGKWLQTNKGAIVGGMRFEAGHVVHGSRTWTLVGGVGPTTEPTRLDLAAMLA